ncbi:hypothetical protein RKE29_30170, partial [Streptomyces sp. B1866]|nr:hypothetical protein [Streptomyces sp. B1866]
PRPRPPAARGPAPRGARFAGVESAEDGTGAAAQAVLPALGVVGGGGSRESAGTSDTPRGARFAGAYDGDEGLLGRRRREEDARGAEERATRDAVLAEARRAAAGAVARLARLRAERRGGEAHVLLVEAAGWPAERLPLLADELERAGLGADVATLLWEAACLPPEALAAAADALAAAGRPADCARLLRQSVSRPVTDVAHAALALREAGRAVEAAFLLQAFVRARTPDEAALAAAAAPAQLVPLLLDAATSVSSSSHHDLALALRAAGVPGAPGVA